MDKCLNCGKDLVHVEGRRKKKYCDENCKGQFFRKVKHEPKYVQIETFNKMLGEYELAKLKLQEFLNPSDKRVDIQDNKPSLPIETPLADNSEILQQIDAIKAEKIPPERNTTNGRKVWAIDQAKRIKELESKLK